jgi:methylmalonyl-CoA mutase
MTSEYGAASQLEKIDMLDFADFVVVNKFEKRGAEDALRDVRKQWRRNHPDQAKIADEDVPVFPTIASQFNDAGVNRLFAAVCGRLDEKWGRVRPWPVAGLAPIAMPKRQALIPGNRVRYLAEIAQSGRQTRQRLEAAADAARRAHGCYRALQVIGDAELPEPLERFPDAALRASDATLVGLRRAYNTALDEIGNDALAQLKAWPDRVRAAGGDQQRYRKQDSGRQAGGHEADRCFHARPIAMPITARWLLMQTKSPNPSRNGHRDGGLDRQHRQGDRKAKRQRADRKRSRDGTQQPGRSDGRSAALKADCAG